MAEALPVYVVHWNAPKWVRATTDSFLASNVPTTVTVVDNGPYDGRLTLDERVRVVATGGNRGYTAAANVGIAEWLAGDAPFCVIACHDVLLDRDALRQMLEVANEERGYGILAPDPRANIVSGRVLGSTTTVTDVEWASGTCLLLRRECIERAGVFDESFGSYGEDQDLCLRTRDAGWRVGLVRGAHARAQGSVNPAFRTQMYVNQVRLRTKRAGARAAVKLVLAFPLLALADAARWVLHRDRVLLQRAAGRVRAIPRSSRIAFDAIRTSRRNP